MNVEVLRKEGFFFGGWGSLSLVDTRYQTADSGGPRLRGEEGGDY